MPKELRWSLRAASITMSFAGLIRWLRTKLVAVLGKARNLFRSAASRWSFWVVLSIAVSIGISVTFPELTDPKGTAGLYFFSSAFQGLAAIFGLLLAVMIFTYGRLDTQLHSARKELVESCNLLGGLFDDGSMSEYDEGIVNDIIRAASQEVQRLGELADLANRKEIESRGEIGEIRDPLFTKRLQINFHFKDARHKQQLAREAEEEIGSFRRFFISSAFFLSWPLLTSLVFMAFYDRWLNEHQSELTLATLVTLFTSIVVICLVLLGLRKAFRS